MAPEATLATAFPLLLAAAGGLLLGLAFYGGLWWTVRRGVPSPRPALWFLGSGLLRTGGVLAGFWWIGEGHWERLAVCLAGLTIGRLLVGRACGSAVRADLPPVASVR